MILLISHTGANKGTNNYFEDFLVKRTQEFLSLSHPFAGSGQTHSELAFFGDDSVRRVLARYTVPNHELVAIMKSFLVSLWVMIRYGKHLHLTIGFGSFNCFAAILCMPFYEYKVYFWGVDYSIRRFSQIVLDTIYSWIETIAVQCSHLVISSSLRQEEARMRRHGLLQEKSLVITNGVATVSAAYDTKMLTAPRTAYMYIGSLSEQHGIVDIVDRYYAQGSIKTPLYIIGGGPLAKKLVHLIDTHALSNYVHYMGVMKPQDIGNALKSIDEKFVGIAPYGKQGKTDHVQYADPLKVKEYLMYGLPYLMSAVVGVSNDIARFGVVYATDTELEEYLRNPHMIPTANMHGVATVLKNYTWDALCAKIPLNT